MQTLNILAPVFLVILLGVLLRKLGFLAAEAPRVLNRYCYWIGLPALLFLKTGLAQPDIAAALATLKICLLVTLGLTVIGIAVGWFLRLRPTQIATLMHVVMRGNLTYVGLSVVIFAFAGSPRQAEAEAIAALILGPIIIIYNIVPSIVHVAAAHRGGQGVARKVLIKLVTNPLILACVLGLAWNQLVVASGMQLPILARRSLTLLSAPALPLALVCVGCGLADTRSVHAFGASSLAAIMKTGLGVLLAYLISRWLHAGPIETAVALILMATPTAVSSYVMVEELGGDPDIAAGSITLSTLLSLITLSLAVSLAL